MTILPSCRYLTLQNPNQSHSSHTIHVSVQSLSYSRVLPSWSKPAYPHCSTSSNYVNILFRLERAVRPLSTLDNRAALSFPAVLVARAKAPVADLTASLVPVAEGLDMLAGCAEFLI